MLPPGIARKLAAAAAIAAGLLYVSFVHSYAGTVWFKDQTEDEGEEETKKEEEAPKE